MFVEVEVKVTHSAGCSATSALAIGQVVGLGDIL